MLGRRGTSRDEPSTGGGGSKGVGLAIAGMIVTFFASLPFVLVVVLYLFVTIYAVVRAIGPGAGENPLVIVIGFVLLICVLALLLAVAVHLIGRSLTPRRRRAKH